MEEQAFFLGCPMWAHADWVGRFFRADAKRPDFLPQYSSVFNAVEGNATFYGLPSVETVARWAVEAPADFRFCFKFPRSVTHEGRLAGGEDEVAEFLERLAPLGDRLGPMLIQLPAGFGPTRLGVLDSFLAALPKHLRYAVEVRHRAFFAEGEGSVEAELNAVLRGRRANRVLFDTTGLFASGVPLTEATASVLQTKPRVPLRRTVTSTCPMVRFVGDPDAARCREALAGWASTFDGWMTSGLTPFFFAHHADDTLAPGVARMFHEALAALRPGLGRLPAWPCDRQRAGADSDDSGGQMTLFS